MHTTLYLTGDERKLFEALPAKIKEGWTVAEEALRYEDTPAKRTTRLHLTKLDDPFLKSFVEEALQLRTPDALGKKILDTDLSGVSEGDLAELFFAMGPEPLCTIIPQLLGSVRSDSDIEDLVALTTIRHSLLAAMQSRSPSA